MTRTSRAVLALLLLASVFPASAAAAGATRTWVSGTGDDVNPCARTSPCKTFAGAISKTETGGIIDALDSGGYGTVTITQGITLDGTGTIASILASGTTGVTVDAPGQDVLLNNISIDGAGVPPCSGINGINLIAAKSLRLTGVTISNFSQNGIRVAPTAANTTLSLENVDINQGCGVGNGIAIAPASPFTVSAMLNGVALTNLKTGLSVADRGHVYLANSTVFNNTVGIQTTGSGIIDSLGGNYIAGNGTNGVPTTEVASGQGPAGSAGSTGSAGAAGPRGETGTIGTITCALHKKKKVIKCKISKAGKAKVSARLSRDGQVVAAGQGTGTVNLHARRALTHGTYRLTLRVDGTETRRKIRL
jgi:hypothetical protein